ncbi:MAG: hypothetical protein AAF843_01140 [Bacteroidota bacterium]
MNVTFGQHTIDDQKAFFSLELGSSPEELNGHLQLDLTISYGLKYYKYRSKDLKTIYGLKVHEINLGFREDKLEYIDIYYDKLDHDEFESLISYLETSYGSSVEFQPAEKGITEAVRWQGKTTVLDVYRYGSEVIDQEDKNKSVVAISRPLK